MILDSYLRTMQIVLGEPMATANCDIVACYAVTNPEIFETYTATASSAGVTPVTVVPAPGLGMASQVNEVRLHNNDSVPHTVKLLLNDNGVPRVVLAQSVLAGGDFLYTPQTGSGAAAIAGGTGTGTGTARNSGELMAQWVLGAVVTNGTCWFSYKAPYAGTITALDAVTGTGSFTAAVKINGTPVTGLSAVPVTGAAATTAATGADTFAAGDMITCTISGATGSPTNAVLNLDVAWQASAGAGTTTPRDSGELLAQWALGTVVSNGTLWLSYRTPYAGTITALDAVTGAGSFTAAVAINGVAVTGLSAVPVGTTPGTTAATGANTFAAGSAITCTVSAAAGSPTNAALNLDVTWS